MNDVPPPDQPALPAGIVAACSKPASSRTTKLASSVSGSNVPPRSSAARKLIASSPLAPPRPRAWSRLAPHSLQRFAAQPLVSQVQSELQASVPGPCPSVSQVSAGAKPPPPPPYPGSQSSPR